VRERVCRGLGREVLQLRGREGRRPGVGREVGHRAVSEVDRVGGLSMVARSG
jgi:hypothetical protein